MTLGTSPPSRIILGIDPGLLHCGWGIIKVTGSRLRYISHGVISPDPKLDLAQRLRTLHLDMMAVLNKYIPTEAAIEETFVNKNPSSALKLGHARGVLLATPALFGISVAAYTANQVKKAVTGVGHGTKDQVAVMVSHLLPLAPKVQEDAADALAIAICHAHWAPIHKIHSPPTIKPV